MNSLLYTDASKTGKEEKYVNESKLVWQMNSGDREAFDELYRIYCKPLLRTVYLMLGNRSDAEDVVQDTFVKVFMHSKELKKEEGFRSWLYQIATRTAWEFGRKRNREITDEEVVIKADEHFLTEGKTIFGMTEQEETINLLIRQEENEALWRAIDGLEQKQKTTVILYYYSEFSTGEIAKITGTLEGTVKSRLFTARKNLKVHLQKDGIKKRRRVV